MGRRKPVVEGLPALVTTNLDGLDQPIERGHDRLGLAPDRNVAKTLGRTRVEDNRILGAPGMVAKRTIVTVHKRIVPVVFQVTGDGAGDV